MHDIFVVTAATEVRLPQDGGVYFRIVTDKEYYTFLYSTDGEQYQMLGSGSTMGLCTEGTRRMTFTGTYLGMFAENGETEFENFTVKVLDGQ